MKDIRGNIILRLLWLAVALCIFNWSVDAPDGKTFPLDSTCNDMESIVKIVLEEVLENNDSIDEKNEHDKSDNFIVPNSSIKDTFCSDYLLSDKFAQYKEQYCEHFHPEIVPRPPKV